MLPFLNIRFVDILDVFMVAVLVYYLYRMLKGTNIIRIFWALLIMYIAWRIFAALGMRFCSQILGGIMSIGLIALVIVLGNYLNVAPFVLDGLSSVEDSSSDWSIGIVSRRTITTSAWVYDADKTPSPPAN